MKLIETLQKLNALKSKKQELQTELLTIAEELGETMEGLEYYNVAVTQVTYDREIGAGSVDLTRANGEKLRLYFTDECLLSLYEELGENLFPGARLDSL